MSTAKITESDSTPALERTDLPITGMTCASCARLIERKLSKLPGVQSAGVNFATSRATVEFSPQVIDSRVLRQTIEDLGYHSPLPVEQRATTSVKDDTIELSQ